MRRLGGVIVLAAIIATARLLFSAARTRPVRANPPFPVDGGSKLGLTAMEGSFSLTRFVGPLQHRAHLTRALPGFSGLPIVSLSSLLYKA
ncbi:hypothetical protein PC116_g24827 [Phytophthora cactorum]|nr:hypothetical protein PC128_g23325 [Phytophthora cactorum]KAG4226774.1 hypothetical protein PC116_g24827 [Phytophthora cactorum]